MAAKSRPSSWLISRFTSGKMVNTNFGQNTQRIGMNVPRGLGPGADGLPFITQAAVDNGLGDLRTAGVARAEKEDFAF
jgi:hypothetical protein